VGYEDGGVMSPVEVCYENGVDTDNLTADILFLATRKGDDRGELIIEAKYTSAAWKARENICKARSDAIIRENDDALRWVGVLRVC
jgi:hypothetical protein